MKSITKMVDGIFTSKIRYGLQLYGKVRVEMGDPICEDLKRIQIAQNGMLRLLNGSKISDQVSIESMLKKFKILPVNQLKAQIKLLEIWKALNVEGYPLKIQQQSADINRVSTRADQRARPVEIGLKNLTKNTCVSDAIRVWNKAPVQVTSSLTVYQAKKEIKNYVTTLPI